MARCNENLELTRFFDNDNSVGVRLVEHLREGCGRVAPRPYSAFPCLEGEGLNMSSLEIILGRPSNNDVDVFVEPLQQSESKNSRKSRDFKKQKENHTPVNQKICNGAPPLENVEDQSPILITDSRDSDRSSLVHHPKCFTPRISASRKSVDVPPADHLRRLSLKRLSKISCSRRTLLQEFENTVSDADFSPRIFSTPRSSKSINDGQSGLRLNNLSQSSNRAKDEADFCQKSLRGSTSLDWSVIQCMDEKLKAVLACTTNSGETEHDKQNENLPINKECGESQNNNENVFHAAHDVKQICNKVSNSRKADKKIEFDIVSEEAGEEKKKCTDKPSEKEHTTNSTPSEVVIPEANQRKSCMQIAPEPNVEEDRPVSVETCKKNSEEISQEPLNLDCKRKNIIPCCEISTEIKPKDTEPSKKATTCNKNQSYKQPREESLNGCIYAKELSGFGNNEILDLRKRKSNNRYRRSRKRSLADRNILQLSKCNDQEQQQEEHATTIKRFVEIGTIQKQQQEGEVKERNIGDEHILSVPDAFRDSSVNTHAENNIIPNKTLLVDETSTDLVSFKISNTQQTRRARSTKISPNLLKKYLDLPRRISLRKRANALQQSMRSLYTEPNLDEVLATNPSQDADIACVIREPTINLPPVSKRPDTPENMPPLRVESPHHADMSDRPSIISVEMVPLLQPPQEFDTNTRISDSSPNVTDNIAFSDKMNTVTKAKDPESSQDGKNLTIVNKETPSGLLNDSKTVFKKPKTRAPRLKNSKAKYNEVASSAFVEEDEHRTIQVEERREGNTAKKPPHSPNERVNKNVVSAETQSVFKRPRGRPSKSSKATKSKVVLSTNLEQTNNSRNTSLNSSLRRSKRQPVPAKGIYFFANLYTEVMEQKYKNGMRTNRKNAAPKTAKIKKVIQNPNKSLGNSSGTTNSSRQAAVEKRVIKKTAAKKTKLKPVAKVKEVKPQANLSTIPESFHENSVNVSRINLRQKPPVESLNFIFDQLRNNSRLLESDQLTSTVNVFPDQPKEQNMQPRKLRVRLRRLNWNNSDRCVNKCTRPTSPVTSPPTPSSTYTNCSSTASTTSELISWLKNATGNGNPSREVFRDMRISEKSSLSFTEIQGIEYAFYDTDDKTSLGYLRFKPKQSKPKKCAKRYHLNFIVLESNFCISTNSEKISLQPGDMAAIQKGTHYGIDNLTDEKGILMVIKK
uniref:Uncharacterized protein n=1 Tax=Glossina austeni TaxID=7395 RepID=A0A1A9VLP8_GLOAU